MTSENHDSNWEADLIGALVDSRPEWAGTATAASLPDPAGDYVPAIDLAVPAGYGHVWTTAPNPVPVIPAAVPDTTDEGPDWGPPVSRDMLEPSDRQTDNSRKPLAHRTRRIPGGSRRYTHILGTDGAVQDIWCAYQPKRVVWKPQIVVLLSHDESDPPAQGLSCVIAYPDDPAKPEYWEMTSRREGVATEVERIMDSLPLAQCLSYRLSLPSKGTMDYLPRSFNTLTKRARAGQFEHDGYTYNLCFRRAKHNPMNVQVGATYASIDEVAVAGKSDNSMITLSPGCTTSLFEVMKNRTHLIPPRSIPLHSIGSVIQWDLESTEGRALVG